MARSWAPVEFTQDSAQVAFCAALKANQTAERQDPGQQAPLTD